MKSIGTLILCLFISVAASAQEFDKAKLDQYFDALEANNKFMGSVALAKDGKIIYARSLGFADVENNIRAGENTKYRIGSITKTFTATLVMKAVERNKLKLEQTLDKFFPDIPNAGKITITHLLSHRSGIHNFTDDADYQTWNTEPRTRAQLVDLITARGSDFEPGSKTAYSNSNYVLLTFILEDVLGKPYATLLRDHITKPVGLTHTAFGGKINPTNGEAKSYGFQGSWLAAPETDMSIPLGAGAIISTPSDLVRFSEALFNGKILTKKSVETMTTPAGQMGLGLFAIPFYDMKGYGHTGGIDGFGSVFAHFPDGNVSFALTSNGTAMVTNDISIAILSAAYNKPYDIPSFTTVTLNAETLDQYPGTYTSTQLPLKITVTRKDNGLMAQATGQSAFPLEATAEHTFKFDQAGIVMEFNPAENTMVLKQGGGQFLFKRGGGR